MAKPKAKPATYTQKEVMGIQEQYQNRIEDYIKEITNLSTVNNRISSDHYIRGEELKKYTKLVKCLNLIVMTSGNISKETFMTLVINNEIVIK